MYLCNICSNLNLGLDATGPRRRLELGSLTELKKRASYCDGCRFFQEELDENSWRVPQYPSAKYLLKPDEVYLIERPPEHHVSLGYTRYNNDIDLDLLTDFTTAPNYCSLHADQTCNRSGRPIHFLSHAGSEASFATLKRWFYSCVHEDCNDSNETHTSLPENFPDLDTLGVTTNPLPSRLIEISPDPTKRPKLVLTDGLSGFYAILSHPWGGGIEVKLTTMNYTQYLEGIEISALPANFVDCFEIARQMGFRYIWIDALCIIQGDGSDFLTESPEMGRYYYNSTLMISATAAESTHSGILKDRSLPRSPVMGKAYLRRYTNTLIKLESQFLTTRAWAAQERVLAPRIVHYLDNQMLWECKHGHLAESKLGVKVTWQDDIGKKWAWSLLNPSPPSYIEATNNIFPGTTTFGISLPNDSATALMRKNAWDIFLADYCRRKLTVKDDKLYAVAGLATSLNDGSLGEYLAGLWEQDLGRNLSWIPQHRRVVTHASCELKDLKEHMTDNSAPESVQYIAPSWSWAINAINETSFNYPWTGSYHYQSVIETGEGGFYPKKLDPTGYNNWVSQHGVAFLSSDIQQGVDTKGLREGSYITVTGSCMNLSPTSSDQGVQLDKIELKIRLDQASVFDLLIPKNRNEVENHQRNENPPRFWTLLQTTIEPRDFKYGFPPRVYALILESLVIGSLTRYRRIGRADFYVKELDDMEWERKTLDLI